MKKKFLGLLEASNLMRSLASFPFPVFLFMVSAVLSCLAEVASSTTEYVGIVSFVFRRHNNIDCTEGNIYLLKRRIRSFNKKCKTRVWKESTIRAAFAKAICAWSFMWSIFAGWRYKRSPWWIPQSFPRTIQVIMWQEFPAMKNSNRRNSCHIERKVAWIFWGAYWAHGFLCNNERFTDKARRCNSSYLAHNAAKQLWLN